MPKKPHHLLLATVEDPFDLRSWSGIPFAMRTALERQVDQLTVFRPSRPSRNPKDVALRLLLRGNPLRWPLWVTDATLRQNAHELRTAIERSRPDAVLSISSQCIARLNPFPVPTYLFSDAPWLAWKETYASFEPLPLRGRRFAELEAAAARRCAGLFFGSEWALRAAERLYFGGQTTANQRALLHEAQLGANWCPEISTAALQHAMRSRPRDQLDLLFVGRDWERKGGPLAVEVLQALRAAGEPARLHIVGCRPTLDPAFLAGDPPSVEVHGPLYRDVPEQRERLQELFLHSHLMLVPTEAECFGIGFAEAQAFGLPPVSRAVQALPSVVLDGITGLLMHPGAAAGEYATRIRTLLHDWPSYEAMAERGLERAANVLSWDRQAERMADVIFSDSSQGASKPELQL